MEKGASLYKSEGSLVNAAKLIFHLQRYCPNDERQCSLFALFTI